MRQELMSEQDWLRMLHVRHPRRWGVMMPLRLADQRELKLDQPGADDPHLVAQVEPQVGGDLVVSAAAGTQLAAELADALQQAALERRVDVLVMRRRPEATGPAGPPEVLERGDHPAELVI